MAIRLPMQGVLDITHTNQGDSSVAGGWAYPFKIPQDTDNVVVKVLPSVTLGGMSATFQTSDDGGTTWYDVARTSIASNSGTTGTAGMNAQWLSIPVINAGVRTGVIKSSSVVAAATGSAAASTLGSQEVSGLPIMGLQNRVFLQSVGNATAINTRVQVKVNSQSSSN